MSCRALSPTRLLWGLLFNKNPLSQEVVAGPELLLCAVLRKAWKDSLAAESELLCLSSCPSPEFPLALYPALGMAQGKRGRVPPASPADYLPCSRWDPGNRSRNVLQEGDPGETGISQWAESWSSNRLSLLGSRERKKHLERERKGEGKENSPLDMDPFTASQVHAQHKPCKH